MPTSIRLSPELGGRLDRLASKTGRTKAYYLRQIIESGISEMEDYYLAADTLERVRRGQEKVCGADSVREDLGLDDYSGSPIAVHRNRCR
jgi:RHH-type rel operon transcriptional repressor/antitoxin RelB